MRVLNKEREVICMNFLYRNNVTMEIVSATLKTIKGKLTATVISVTSNGITQFEESVFNKFFTHFESS